VFSFPEAACFLKTTPVLLNPASRANGASIDTRTLLPGNFFIALQGAQQDGHQYLEEAFKKGASGALISRAFFEAERNRLLGRPELFQNLLFVPDPETALRDLAVWHRSHFNLPTIGITGSVAKTSTKEFLTYLLRKRFSVLASSGNFNNHLGLPLTLLGLNASHQFCVAELGANHLGEIRTLADILKPTAGILTQVSAAHLEGFGSLEGIYQAKMELFEALPQAAPAVLPDDDVTLFERAKKLKLNLIRVGFSKEANFRISDVRLENGFVSFAVKGNRRFSFPGMAAFFARNAGLALAMIEALGVPLEDMPEVWEDFKLPSGRFQERRLPGNIQMIYDGYNANPASFLKALESFAALPVSGRKILIFADMLELGPEETKFHEVLGHQIAGFGFDAALAYGSRTAGSIEAIEAKKTSVLARHFKDSKELADFLLTFIKAGDCLLLKASRGMKIEEVMKTLEEKLDCSQPVTR